MVAQLGVGGSEHVFGSHHSDHKLRGKIWFLAAIASAAAFTSGEFQEQFHSCFVRCIEGKRLQEKGSKRPNGIGSKLLLQEVKNATDGQATRESRKGTSDVSVGLL